MQDDILLQILNPEVQTFIQKHLNDSITSLALQKNPFPTLDFKVVLAQIESKKKCKTKLPTWYNTSNIIFPNKISIEQTSSEKTALYKSNLFQFNSLIDITGGFGIDAFYFSKTIKKVIYVEKQNDLAAIVAHNFKTLNANNINCFAGDGLEYLQKNKPKIDAIYLDPARRNENATKVFLWEDCTPNIIENKEKYFEFANTIIIKTSPLFDLSLGIKTLKNVKEIHIIALENEVKELLWVLEKDYQNKSKIKAINLNKNQTDYFETLENTPEIEYSLPLKYLYEPNAAMMKMGDFKSIAAFFNLKKLHQHTHLFTSDEMVDFMGRKFEIIDTIPYHKNTVNQYFKHKKWNVSIRNFPESVATIQQKFKIKDGGESYCFFTTLLNQEKNVLLCKKIN